TGPARPARAVGPPVGPARQSEGTPPMLSPSPSVDHLRAIHDATRNLLTTYAVYWPILDDPPGTIDAATASARLAVDMALSRLECLLNPGREPYSAALAIRAGGSGWPGLVLTALAVLPRVVYALVERWDLPEICEGRTITRNYGPGESMPPRTLTD